MRDRHTPAYYCFIEARTVFAYNRCLNCSMHLRTCVFVYDKESCRRCSKLRVVCLPSDKLPCISSDGVNTEIGSLSLVINFPIFISQIEFRYLDRKLSRHCDNRAIHTKRDHSKLSEVSPTTSVSILHLLSLFL